MTRGEQMQVVQKEALALFEKKNKDYGNAFANFGTIGVLVRLSDKISRAVSISKSSVTLVKDESLRDTLIDLHNYAAMAIMLMDEKSPKEIMTDHLPNLVTDGPCYISPQLMQR